VAEQILGTPSDAPGSFSGAFEVDFDAAGCAYVAESVNERIQRVAPDGSRAGIWPLDFSPRRIGVSPEGSVFVAGRHYLTEVAARLDECGNVLWEKTYGEAAITNDVDVADDGTAVRLSGGHSPDIVSIYDAQGRVKSSWEAEIYSNQIAIDQAGRIHVIGGVFGGWWRVYDQNGTELEARDAGARLDYARDFHLDSMGRAVVVDNDNRMWVIEEDGSRLGPCTFPLPGMDHPGRNSTGWPPYIVGFFLNGDQIVATTPRSLFKGTFSTEGIRQIWSIGKLDQVGEFLAPGDVAASPGGLVAISDGVLKRIQVFLPDGTLLWILEHPLSWTGIEVDNQGRVLLGGDGVLERWSPTGLETLHFPYPESNPDDCGFGESEPCIPGPKSIVSHGNDIFLHLGGFVSRITESGADTLLNLSQRGYTRAMTVTSEGELVVFQGAQLSRYDRNGAFLGAVPLELTEIVDIAAVRGDIYIIRRDGSQVFVMPIEGGSPRPLDLRGLGNARGIATDGNDLIVIDGAREVVHRVRL
jgi:sugar lactone lactonase YvrE